MMTSYPRAAVTQLRFFFGRSWPIVLAVLAALVFWPLLVFRSAVQFSASAFVEKWIQTGVTSIFVFLAIEIARRRAIDYSAREEELRVLTSECAAPAAIMLEGLDLLGRSIHSGDLSGARTWTRVVTDAWQPLRTHLSKSMTVSQSESVIRTRLSTLAGRCDVPRIENAITALAQTNELSEFSEKEIEWLMTSVTSIAQDLRTIDTNA
jgi:hypothetical protein